MRTVPNTDTASMYVTEWVIRNTWEKGYIRRNQNVIRLLKTCQTEVFAPFPAATCPGANPVVQRPSP